MESSYPVTESQPSYPVTFSVDYPERQLNRLSTFFRIFAVIPIAIILASLPGSEITAQGGSEVGGSIAGGSLAFSLVTDDYPPFRLGA